MTQIFEGEGPLTFDQTRALADLTRGNEPDRGWAVAENGGRVAGIYDRRRLVVAAVTMYAERNRLQAVPGPAISAILRNFFEVDGDAPELAKNFVEWRERSSRD